MGTWGCGSPAQTRRWGTPAQPQDTGFLLCHGDMGILRTHRNVGASLSFEAVRFPLSYGNIGLFLSHKDTGFPLDYGEVGLCHGDLGFLLGHRNEGFLLNSGDVGFSLCQGDKGDKAQPQGAFKPDLFPVSISRSWDTPTVPLEGTAGTIYHSSVHTHSHGPRARLRTPMKAKCPFLFLCLRLGTAMNQRRETAMQEAGQGPPQSPVAQESLPETMLTMW